MTTFAKQTFNSANYLSYRPYYTSLLYKIIYDYHKLPFDTAVDLGCGPGIVTTELYKKFNRVIGIDPSEKMLSAVQAPPTESGKAPIEFKVASAEDLSIIKSSSVDMITAGQAAHWFKQDNAFHEIARVLKPGGTLAFFCYGDVSVKDHPEVKTVLRKYAYGGPGTMGPYWEEPGRSIVVGLYKDIVPPDTLFQDVTRHYFPRSSLTGEREKVVQISNKMTFRNMRPYARTWSSFHRWQNEFPDRKSRESGGTGDIVDDMFDAFEDVTGWNEDTEFEVEWDAGILLARKREI